MDDRTGGLILIKYFQLAAFLATISCSPALAASIKDSPLDNDQNVGVVVVQGEFISGDANRFNAAIQKYSKGIVLFESGGGDLATGLEIGTTIRMKGFRTGVAPNSLCASSCALAWLGGVERYLSPTSKLGFHAAYSVDGSTTRETGLGNAVVGAYLTRIGLPIDAVIYITKAPPEEMTWLNPDDAKKVGIDLSILADDKPNGEPPKNAEAPSLPVQPPAQPATAELSGPILAGPPSSPPSFDCLRAVSDDEKAICGDAILARADALIANEFRAVARTNDPGTRYWLRVNNIYRENCHSDVLCILTVQERSVRLLGADPPSWMEEYKARLAQAGIGAEWRPVLPTRIGQCVNTSIVGITDRFGSPLSPYLDSSGFDSGSAADFRNGGHVISYSKEPFLLNSRTGDRVKMCLVAIPQNCPPGDERGRQYRIVNMRTREGVVMADAQHMCGGA